MDVDRLTRAWPLVRDAAIVVVALALIIFEATTKTDPREGLLFLYTGMLGLPVVAWADRRSDRQDSAKPAPPAEET